METRICPSCGAVTTDEFTGYDKPSFECPNGHGAVTEEGLLSQLITNVDGSKSVVEVGKGNFVISRGSTPSDRLTSLLDAILRLETKKPTDETVADLRQRSATNWNLKRAKRRFRRWLRDYKNDLPTITDSRMLELAERLRNDQSQVRTDNGWSMEDILRWSSSGFLYELKQYEDRLDEEPLLLVGEEIPQAIRKAFQQARECYRWGLYAAAFGLCRIVLESSVR
jgi:hypothetical protein